MKLTEAYAKRLAISESVYSKKHNGEKMDSHKKIAVAKCLQNVNSFLNEAFDASVGTQRSDMGLFKKFCLNLTTVALPNLIAHDLVMVSPMSSMSGYVTYIEYQYSNTKGETEAGTTFNSPFGLGDVDVNYTGAKVVEPSTTAFTKTTAAWKPLEKAFAVITVNGEEVEFDPRAEYTKAEKDTLTFKAFKAITTVTATGATTVAFYGIDETIEAPAEGSTLKVAYVYDNE